MTELNELNVWNQPDEGDPLIWIHRVRMQMHKRCPTPEARRHHYDNAPSYEERRVRIAKRIEEKLNKGYCLTDLYLGEDD